VWKVFGFYKLRGRRGPAIQETYVGCVELLERSIVMYSRRFLCRPTAFFRLAGAVERQRALHTENSGFVSVTLRRHISTFRGYGILFSIRKPYINRFTNHFLFIHNHLTLRKWCYTPLSQGRSLR
jgi:hypothetical protein